MPDENWLTEGIQSSLWAASGFINKLLYFCVANDIFMEN